MTLIVSLVNENSLIFLLVMIGHDLLNFKFAIPLFCEQYLWMEVKARNYYQLIEKYSFCNNLEMFSLFSHACIISLKCKDIYRICFSPTGKLLKKTKHLWIMPVMKIRVVKAKRERKDTTETQVVLR